jgi:hypothetical protein
MRVLVQRVFVLVAAVSAIIPLTIWGWQTSAQATQDEEGKKGGGSGNVMLRIAGDKGTPFSGTCSVGDEEHDISGRVPQRFNYDLNDRKLVCEIRKQDAQGAELNVILKDENTRSVHRSVGGEDTAIRLVYEDGNVSSSMSSTSTQTMSSTSSSSSSAANDATRGADNQETLAEQIQKKVDRIIEQAMLQ